MSNPSIRFINAVRTKLPDAKVFWTVEPDLEFHTRVPSLTAVNNQNKSFTMDFPKGLPAEPFDDVVDKFIQSFMETLNE